MFQDGDLVKVLKCPQAPKLVGQVGTIIEKVENRVTLYVVQFCDGYKRIMRSTNFEHA